MMSALGMGSKKKTKKLTEDEKRALFRETVERLYATEASWRSILLEKGWVERIYLLQSRKKIESVLTDFRHLTKS